MTGHFHHLGSRSVSEFSACLDYFAQCACLHVARACVRRLFFIMIVMIIQLSFTGCSKARHDADRIEGVGDSDFHSFILSSSNQELEALIRSRYAAHFKSGSLNYKDVSSLFPAHEAIYELMRRGHYSEYVISSSPMNRSVSIRFHSNDQLERWPVFLRSLEALSESAPAVFLSAVRGPHHEHIDINGELFQRPKLGDVLHISMISGPMTERDAYKFYELIKSVSDDPGLIMVWRLVFPPPPNTVSEWIKAGN